MNEKDIAIISSLRGDARMALTEISKKTQIPVSTIFDRLKLHEKTVIKKHTSIVDFEKMGYNSKTVMVLKTKYDKRVLLKDYLESHNNVNNLYITNSGYDFMIETVFRNQKETQDFVDEIERHFELQEVKAYNIIEDVHREKFLSP